MSTDKEKLSQLLEKVDRLATELNKTSEELRSVSASVKSLAVGQITQPPPLNCNRPHHMKLVLNKDHLTISVCPFPEELEARLSFEEKGEYIIIKPKQFLGSENFAKIASAVRGMGGEYISAGKDSHFRVPKKKTS